jgi:hypothetical protein
MLDQNALPPRKRSDGKAAWPGRPQVCLRYVDAAAPLRQLEWAHAPVEIIDPIRRLGADLDQATGLDPER